MESWRSLLQAYPSVGNTFDWGRVLETTVSIFSLDEDINYAYIIHQPYINKHDNIHLVTS